MVTLITQLHHLSQYCVMRVPSAFLSLSRVVYLLTADLESSTAVFALRCCCFSFSCVLVQHCTQSARRYLLCWHLANRSTCLASNCGKVCKSSIIQTVTSEKDLPFNLRIKIRLAYARFSPIPYASKCYASDPSPHHLCVRVMTKMNSNCLTKTVAIIGLNASVKYLA